MIGLIVKYMDKIYKVGIPGGRSNSLFLHCAE